MMQWLQNYTGLKSYGENVESSELENLKKQLKYYKKKYEKEDKEMEIPSDKEEEITPEDQKKIEDDIKKDKLEVKKTSYLKEFKELNLSRALGDLYCQDLGIISEPEIVEIDLKYNKGRYIVLGTNSLFTYLTNEEIGNIVKKYYYENNGFEACKELEELARERWKKNLRAIEDITVIIIFLDLKR